MSKPQTRPDAGLQLSRLEHLDPDAAAQPFARRRTGPVRQLRRALRLLIGLAPDGPPLPPLGRGCSWGRPC